MSFISNNTFGTLSSAPEASIITQIFNYISSILENFQAHSNENENAITNRFCKVLSYKKPPEYPYFFHHQNLENDKDNTSTDFAVFETYSYSQGHEIFDNGIAPALITFEAKRLSTALPKKREREYVIGEYEQDRLFRNSGGIERFKNGRHGKEVNIAGLIGYVQAESFAYWHEKINGWILEEIKQPHNTELRWEVDDTLKLVNSNTRLASYTSASKRHFGTPILLRHLWVSFV